MSRKIIGCRFLDKDNQTKKTFLNEVNAEWLGKETASEEVSQFDTGLTIGELKTKLNKGGFVQYLIHTGTKPNYWLDSSWFLEQGFSDRTLLSRVINEFNETNFPPQKTVDVKQAYCVDAVQWDFHVKPVKLGVHESIPIPEEDKPDYLLRKQGIDYKHLAETSLFTVNGFVHDSAYDQDGIYVRGGYKTALNNGEINVGIICFEDISRLKTINISESNFIKPIEDLPHTKAFYLKFDEQDFTGKNLAIVIGGYLHFINGSKVVRKVGTNTLRIDAQEFHYHRRIKEVVRKLDKDKRLGLTNYEDGRWNNREIEAEATLTALLNLPQTFLVEFSATTPFIFHRRLLHRANYPRRYFDTKRHYPLLRLSDGRYPAYLLKDDKNGFVIATIKNTKRHKFDDTARTWNEPYVTDYDRTTFPEEVLKGEFVSIQAVATVDERKNNYEGQIVRNQD